jgi:hypothetical protein
LISNGFCDLLGAMSQDSQPIIAQISVGRPERFSAGAMLALNAYGLVLVIPVVVAVAGMTLLHAGYSSLLLPLAAVALTAYFLPFGLGNAHVARMVRSARVPAARIADTDEVGFVVQLTLEPRIRPGLRGLIEDADDIGWLRITDEALVYDGDSVRLAIPWSSVSGVARENIGLRGLYVCGPRTRVTLSGVPEAESLEFAERSSWTVPASQRVARELYERVRAAREAGGSKADPAAAGN